MFVTPPSDYGLADEFVGVLHGVIARRAALPHMPAGVHLAVVDPEVGASRRAVALRYGEEDRLLVGPDNGLLIRVALVGSERGA